jgi:molybdopterin molybdotransferase
VGLPGNPLAAIVAYLTLVDPVCAGIVGRELPVPATVGGCDVRPHPTRTRLVPVTVSGDRALACGYVGSAMLRGVADADALAVIEPDTAGRIDLLPLPGGLR